MLKELQSKAKLVQFTLASLVTMLVIIIFYLIGSQQQPLYKTLSGLPLEKMSKTQLEEEKLRQEILKTDAEVQQQRLSRITSIGSAGAALVAIIGVGITIWKTFTENTRQRVEDGLRQQTEQEQRERERVQREIESLRQLRGNLGAETSSIRVSAAVSMFPFLQSGSDSLHEEVYWILLGNLKIPHESQINRFMVRAFERVIRMKLLKVKPGEWLDLPLDRVSLERIDLSGLDLSQTNLTKKSHDAPSRLDLGFAYLQGANLNGTHLQRTRGIRVNLKKARLSKANLSEVRFQKADLSSAILHEAIMVAADLKKAKLKGAQLQRAQLQSAHFENADLRGASFEQANLADTFFYGAKLSFETRQSILKAQNWRKAHFDSQTKKKLDALANPQVHLRWLAEYFIMSYIFANMKCTPNQLSSPENLT